MSEVDKREHALAEAIKAYQQLEAIPIIDGLVRLDAVPERFMEELMSALYGQTMTADGRVYQADFDRFKSRYFQDIQRLTAPSEAEDPRVELAEWNVMKTVDGSFLVGRSEKSGEFRRTAQIIGFDMEDMSIITQGGRVYALVGSPTRNRAIEENMGWDVLRQSGLISSWV